MDINYYNGFKLGVFGNLKKLDKLQEAECKGMAASPMGLCCAPISKKAVWFISRVMQTRDDYQLKGLGQLYEARCLPRASFGGILLRSSRKDEATRMIRGLCSLYLFIFSFLLLYSQGAN
jgi:hypothetical protein